MNSFRSLSFTKLIRNTQNLSLFNAQRFSSAVAPITKSRNLPDTQTSSARDDIVRLEDLPTHVSPSFNFAAYVNKSETLKKFVELGVDLSKIEKKKGLPQFVLKLDFENDVKRHLFLLHDLGLPAEYFGYFLTKNPLIFKESIADLETRVYYLRSKNFTLENVREIVGKNPFWLSFSTKRIDQRLGWFQKNFKLTGREIRSLTVKQPKLLTYNLEHVRESTFTVKEEMGFDEVEDVKQLLLSAPSLWMMSELKIDLMLRNFTHLLFTDHTELIERFAYINNTMKISHKQILQSPEILSSRLYRLKQRFGFLKFLGKAQFDPTQPGFISFRSFVEGTDKDFVFNVAKSSLETYDDFLKTL